MDLWATNPRFWHAHPLAIVAGLGAAVVLAVVLAVVFWIRGRWWP